MIIYRINLLIILLSMLSITSCKPSKADSKMMNNSWEVELPEHFESLPVPRKNLMNKAKVELGARLFYDPILSLESNISCSSCHLPQFAFSDQREKSIGNGDSLSIRNAPVLINLAYAPTLMMDGGIPNLEIQVVAPLTHEGEMGFDLFDLVKRISDNEKYQDLSQQAFDRKIDATVIAYSLAAFQRSILSYESKYDNFLSGDIKALNQEEKRGLDLFFSASLNCNACHLGSNLTDYRYYNLGLYEQYNDPGRWRVTEDSDDRGKFKVPTLRNIEYSFPYMHDGSITTLKEVIEFKMSGGKEHINKSDKFKAFVLNDADQIALLAFLTSLSDEEFIKREIERRDKL